MNQNPEQIARDKIDQMLVDAGWFVQSKDNVNLSANIGVTLREVNTETGPADYILFVNAKAVGEGQVTSVLGLMTLEVNLFHEIMDRKIERRLNHYNVFDFDYTPSENDQLFYMKMKMSSSNSALRMKNGASLSPWEVLSILSLKRHYLG